MALWDGEAVTQRQGGGGFSSHSSNTPPCEFWLLETQQPPRMPSSGECSGSPGRQRGGLRPELSRSWGDLLSDTALPKQISLPSLCLQPPN